MLDTRCSTTEAECAVIMVDFLAQQFSTAIWHSQADSELKEAALASSPSPQIPHAKCGTCLQHRIQLFDGTLESRGELLRCKRCWEVLLCTACITEHQTRIGKGHYCVPEGGIFQSVVLNDGGEHWHNVAHQAVATPCTHLQRHALFQAPSEAIILD